MTVLVPWFAPKLVPAIVTDPPTTPEAGVRLVMPGADGPPLGGTGVARNANMAHDWFPALYEGLNVNCCMYVPAEGAIWYTN